MTNQKHITVLAEEAVDALAIKGGSTVVDATLGAAGHARRIIDSLKGKGTFVGIDADYTAIEAAKPLLTSEGVRIELQVGNFRDINSILDGLHIETVDGILADLGWRMEQFSGNGRGFSFKLDEPLLMTFGDPSLYSFVAHDIVNEWKEGDIINVLKGYGEERWARRIAAGIVQSREQKPIMTTFDLVSVINDAVPSFYKNGKIHPATRTFQALRIAVNDEFDTLSTFIDHAIMRLSPGGRLAIITFHSLEDRIVKHKFRAFAHDQCGEVLTKKPIVASRDALLENPRARSAKLRIFEKHAGT